jgi:hypothetical protein
MVATSLEEGNAIDSIERIFKVHLEQHLVLVPRVALEPLAGNPNAYFSSQGLGHPYLKWEQKCGCLLLEGLAKAFAHQSPPGFPDGDWPDAAVLLGQGGQGSPCQVGGDIGWGTPRGKEADQGGDVL